MKARLADIGIAALIAAAFILDEIVARRRLSAFAVALILAGLVLPWWAGMLILTLRRAMFT